MPYSDLRIPHHQYNSNQLVKIIIASNSHDRMKPDRTKQLIYKDSLLTELTNTWVFPLELINTDTLFQMYKDQGERLTDITSTKFEYYPNRRLKKLKKVYGMWPGESYWETTFYYHDNGLIRKKEHVNNDEFGKNIIQMHYNYE